MEIEDEERSMFRRVPKGGGFQKNEVIVASLDPDIAAGHVNRERRRSQTLMHTREMEIDAGLEHLTPAGEDHKRRKGADHVR